MFGIIWDSNGPLLSQNPPPPPCFLTGVIIADAFPGNLEWKFSSNQKFNWCAFFQCFQETVIAQKLEEGRASSGSLEKLEAPSLFFLLNVN